MCVKRCQFSNKRNIDLIIKIIYTKLIKFKYGIHDQIISKLDE